MVTLGVDVWYAGRLFVGKLGHVHKISITWFDIERIKRVVIIAYPEKHKMQHAIQKNLPST